MSSNHRQDELFRFLSNPTKRNVLQLVFTHGVVTSPDVAIVIGIIPREARRILKDATELGLLNKQYEHPTMFYSARPSQIREIINDLRSAFLHAEAE